MTLAAPKANVAAVTRIALNQVDKVNIGAMRHDRIFTPQLEGAPARLGAYFYSVALEFSDARRNVDRPRTRLREFHVPAADF